MLKATRFSVLLLAGGMVVLQMVVPRGLALQGEDVTRTRGLGEPLDGLTAGEFELFRLGLDDFTEVETALEGLGPIFNGRSCSECHSSPAIGGAGTVTEVRAGILREDGVFEQPPGGSLFQMFSLPPHRVQNLIPEQANVVAHRRSLPLFGAGLVEAVPDDLLLALEDPDDRDGDGVSGRAHRVADRATGQVRIGRFGWKAQQASLLAFGAEAYRDEMGITNDLFAEEVCPGGDCESIRRIDLTRDPEDRPERSTGLRGVDNFENFMRLLGPPLRGPVGDLERRGEGLLLALGCGACHVPSLTTGPSPVNALHFRSFSPYGDFLLHDIGTGDGIAQGDAQPEEIRTPPLWGVRFRAPFLHNGRASSLNEAIRKHSGEAEKSSRAYDALSGKEKEALLAFLRSL
jgi:CxxC motif-containing protein (DUF1111 family)